MSDSEIPAPRDLPNKPLVEAIFEFRWALQSNPAGGHDPGFRILLGRFYDRVSGILADNLCNQLKFVNKFC